jgi:hypothetical protein
VQKSDNEQKEYVVPVVGSDHPKFVFLEHYLTKATNSLKALRFEVMNQQLFFYFKTQAMKQ